VEAIELDWGCGYVQHYAEVGRVGALVRLSALVPARLARGVEFEYVRVRFRSHESMGARIERVEPMADGSVRLILLAAPSPFAPRSDRPWSGPLDAPAVEGATPPTRPKGP
jgi:hypothetical protein